MCAKNISDSDHLGIVWYTVPCKIKGNKEGKPGFEIYAYLTVTVTFIYTVLLGNT